MHSPEQKYSIEPSKALISQIKTLRPSIRAMRLKDLFDQDSNRFEQFSFQLTDHILIDYSKHPFTKETLSVLFKAVEPYKLLERIEDMYSGAALNFTENRAVLHTALRALNSETDSRNLKASADMHNTLNKMEKLVSGVLTGKLVGYRGDRFTDVVHIGIGGSDLGPRMAYRALIPYQNHLKVHFVANVDGTELIPVLKSVKPESTLFIIASKSFKTPETLLNAQTTRDWFCSHFTEETVARAALAKHFIAISANLSLVQQFGIDLDLQFPLWDFIGGRFSMWSAVGLPIALGIGFEQFKALLAGAHSVDNHFQSHPLHRNVPIILALISLLHQHCFDNQTEAIIPYEQALNDLPAYLQQAIMESNGKRINSTGQPVTYATAPIIWGGVGTNGQHAFFQLLHQGTHHVPCDFIASIRPHHPLQAHHDLLLANYLAQTRALAFGRSIDSIASTPQWLPWTSPIQDARVHRACPGEQASTSILLDQLSPTTLGELIALYEHRICVQGWLLDICSFDQFGVELGKNLADEHLIDLKQPTGSLPYDSSTRGLIQYIRAHRA